MDSANIVSFVALGVSIGALTLTFLRWDLGRRVARDARAGRHRDREDRKALARLNLYKRLQKGHHTGPHEPRDTLTVEATAAGVSEKDLEAVLGYQRLMMETGSGKGHDQDERMERRRKASQELRRILLDEAP